MRWGKYDGEGSEHRVDGCANEVEIQFVHTLQGATDPTESNYYAVIAALAEVDDVNPELEGPWSLLNPEAVREYNSKTSIRGLILNQILPFIKDFWIYEGSLTTPPCTETVDWYVLNGIVQIPRQFVDQLRLVESNSDGELVERNYRNLQDMGTRVVTRNL